MKEESYSVPVGIAEMSSEAASMALDKIYAAVGGDVNHPYANGHSPLHGRFQRAVTALHRVKTADKSKLKQELKSKTRVKE